MGEVEGQAAGVDGKQGAVLGQPGHRAMIAGFDGGCQAWQGSRSLVRLYPNRGRR